MRLWHKDLIPHLPRQQLLGQHRECCALRGLGWGRKHATVDYVFRHPYTWLVRYHKVVMHEMLRRGYRVDPVWWNIYYQGKKLGYLPESIYRHRTQDYPEHNTVYLAECLLNLMRKNVVLGECKAMTQEGKSNNLCQNLL